MSESLNKVLAMPHQPAEHMDWGESLQHEELLYHTYISLLGWIPSQDT